MKRRRSIRLAAALALLLNLGGGPAAWAHWLETSSPAGTSAMPNECHAHTGAQPADDSMPCCEDGDCDCAAPPAVVLMPTLHEQRLSHFSPELAFDPPPLPSSPLDDDLRPPIA